LINFRINQKPPDPTGEAELGAAQGLSARLALGLLSREELARWRRHPPLADGDAVQGAVQLAVATPVEADALARGGGDRGHAGETSELAPHRGERHNMQSQLAAAPRTQPARSDITDLT
jgi:hypothetical protein